MRVPISLDDEIVGALDGCVSSAPVTSASAGLTPAQADCLIAATAVALGVPLATGNPEAFAMPELEVQHWPIGA